MIEDFRFYGCVRSSVVAVVVQSDLHSTVWWVGAAGRWPLPSWKGSEIAWAGVKAGSAGTSEGKRKIWSVCALALGSRHTAVLKICCLNWSPTAHVQIQIFFSVLFCFFCNAEPKGWDGNLWWCSVYPAYVNFRCLFEKNVCFWGRLEEGEGW